MPAIYRNGIEYTCAPGHIGELQDVNITTPTSAGQVLAYDGNGKVVNSNTLKDLKTHVNDLYTLGVLNYTLTSSKTAPANGLIEIGATNDIIPNNSVFVSASLLGGTTAGLTNIIMEETYWGSTAYISARNPTSGSIEIPIGKVIKIRYMKKFVLT